MGSATEVLQQAGAQFVEALGRQAGQVDEVATHVAASAVELSSLSESFAHGVGLLLLKHTGRIRMFGQDTTLLFDAYVIGLLERVRQRLV